MRARVKAIFKFACYVDGEYSNEASYIKGNTATFKQAIAEVKKYIRNFSANHIQIFLTVGNLAVADVTMHNYEITVNDYNDDYRPVNAATKTTTPEFSELSHAAQCLDIYLNNTREIYDRYTVPAIKDNVTAFRHRNGAKYTAAEYWEVLERTAIDMHDVKKALRAAARLVKLHDGLTPTPADIEQAARNYAAYIMERAKYEIENA